MALLNNAWVDSYLDALLSAGLSTESARKASEQHSGTSPDVDADTNLAAKYYVQQILAMDEESIQQAWLKVHARSNVRLAAERDARLEHICWRVWSMRRKAAAVATLRARRQAGAGPEGDYYPDTPPDSRCEEAAGLDPAAVDEEELSKLYGAPSTAPALRRLSIPARRAASGALSGSGVGGGAAAAAAAAAELLSDSSGEPTPTLAGGAAQRDALAAFGGALPASPGGGGGAAAAVQVQEPAAVGLSLGEGRVPKLYCVLISMHGLVRGDRMELGKDPDTGGQVKYVIELAKALSRHPAVHRVDLLTRLIRDPGVDGSYGVAEEVLEEGWGQTGGAFIVRIPCGPVDKYIRKEALWPYVREFADNALDHVNGMMARMAAAGEVCELYDIHGHYADAGEAAALMSFTLGVDMVLTGHSLGRNKLEHLLKSGTITRHEIESTYAMSRRIEGEERALDAAMMVFTSTHQEVKDQWGLYDGYDPDLEAIIRQRPRRGRHFPAMKVVPPGLDFSNLKVDCPPDPWQQLAAASAASGTRSRRTSVAGAAAAAAAAAAVTTVAQGAGEGEVFALKDAPSPAASPASRRTPSSPFLRGLPSQDHMTSSPSALVTSSPSAAASPRGLGLPPPLLPGAGGSGAPPGAPPVGPLSPTSAAAALGALGLGVGFGSVGMADPPIWKEIFRFLRNPRKPVILAMSRPDAKKNITTLVRAYGQNRALREIANLVLVMGNRTVIDGMAAGSAKVLESVLKLIDTYDLYGSVAYPKRHTQDDISDIYLLPHHTRGVFVNVALQEPFGLTLIEAAAHGVPIVATTHGGPVDIVHTLRNGTLVNPTDTCAVSEALLKLLTDPGLWEQYATAGRDNINAYSWPSHCITCLNAVEQEKIKSVSRRKTAMRSTYSADMDDLQEQDEDTKAEDTKALMASAAGDDPQSNVAPTSDQGPRRGPGGYPQPPPSPFRAAAGGASAGDAFDAALAVADGAGGGGASRFGGLSGASSLPLTPPSPLARVAAPQQQLSSAADASPAPRSPVPRSPHASGGSLDQAAFNALLSGGRAGPIHGPGGFPEASASAALMASKSRYVVLLLDSSDTASCLASLLARKDKALLSLAAGGGAVGVGVASAYGLPDTLRMLGASGLSPSDLDFAVVDCGAQVWYGGAAAAVAAAAVPARTWGGAGASGRAPPEAGCVADDAYDHFADFRWDKISVRRVLAQLLAQRSLLMGLSGSGDGAAAPAAGKGQPPAVKISVDTETGSHHLLIAIRPRHGAADGGGSRGGADGGGVAAAASASPVLSPQEQLALVARIKKRFRASGLRTQITSQLEGDGTVRLHITPPRCSRALALRYLAHRHKVELSSLVVVSCARDLSPASGRSHSVTATGDAGPSAPARFATSDAEDLISGAMGALVVPPLQPQKQQQEVAVPAGVVGGGTGGQRQLLGGFMVDLGLYQYDGRLQVLTAPLK